MAVLRKNKELNDAIEVLDEAFIRAQNDVELAMAYLTPDEMDFVNAETMACLDQRYYLENYHCIRDEQGNWKALYPWWDHQEIVYEAVTEEFNENGYCKLIVLKPRQTGLTTWTAASMFHRTIFNAHNYTMLVAQDPERSANMYTMCINAYQALPWWLRPESQYQTKGDAILFQRKDEMERLVNPGLGSTIQCSHAQKTAGVAIGRTIRNLHASEASRWPSSDVFHADILPSMNARDTYAVMESTGYGRNGLMYDWWETTVEGDNDWRALFIPVYKVKKYYLPIKKALTLTEEEAKFTARVEREEQFTIPNEFWNFRRLGIRAATRGKGKSGFLESYPITPQEAFQASGLCAFDRDKLEEQQMRNTCRPIYAGDIFLADDNCTPTPVYREVGDDEVLPKRKGSHATDRLWIWLPPDRGQVYYVSADASLGVKGGDYSCCQVIRVGTATERDEQVAEFIGHIPPQQFARLVAALGYWYNGAEIAVEYQAQGISVGDKLKDLDYPALYRVQHKDRIGNTMGVHLHWLTTIKTRDGIIGNLNEALIEDSVIIRSEDLIEECIDFSSLNGGTRFEGVDNHDDAVLSFMIGLYCARETQQHLKASPSTQHVRETGDLNVYGVYDNLMRQRGQYQVKADAEKQLVDQNGAIRTGWKVQPILICKANTIYSPIFDGTGAENDLRFRHGMRSNEIVPEVVHAYRDVMAGVRGVGGGVQSSNDEW